jgi:tRNA threonylcarbamoyladenosine biosynthesis protein TsaB
MQILALDTASPIPSVTLLAAGGGVWEESIPQDRRASEELLPAIERCLASAGTSLTDCDRIAVCSGPGSFTGLRIGLATAWALGRATGVAVETASTLEALAESLRGRGALRVAAALDAGRGEVVLAFYSLEGRRAQLESEPVRLPLEGARERAAGIPLISLPPDLVTPRGEAAGVSPSRALAFAVARAPGKPLSRLAGMYSRPSAAEERHGSP